MHPKNGIKINAPVSPTGALRLFTKRKKRKTMKRSFFIRFTALILLLTTLVGCSGDKATPKDEVDLTKEQRQSLSMLNYLTVLTQKIVQAQNNQLFLEDAYLELTSNINPEAVDAKTQELVGSFLDSLQNLRMLEVKRERLQYTYEQERARSLEAQLEATTGDVVVLMSNPNATNIEWAATALKTTVSVGRMIFGDVKSTAELELQYTKDEWELDDTAAEVINTRRMESFDYMVEIARENDIPGEYTLTEASVIDFVNWKYNDNLTGRIQFLESHQDIYKYFGEYWLTLASSYYDNDDYQKCIDAVIEYEKLSEDAGILRKDYNYASVLPMCIVSAREVYKEDMYVDAVKEYLPLILDNSRDNDWVGRYFVAEVYVDLYQKTDNSAYLQSAYDVMLNLTNILMLDQQKANKAYLENLVAVTVEENASDEQKQEAEAFNKVLTELRKVELPPISEPLRICGEMLFALADELSISEEEKDKITKMLHNDGTDLFYNLIYDNEIRFDPDETDPQIANMTVKYDAEGNLKLPVILVTQNSHIKVSAVSKSKTTILEDWTLKKVERKGENVEEFLAVYKSKKAADFEYKDGMAIIIEIYGSPEAETPDYTVEFKAKVDTTLWLFDDVSFKRVS